jgi:membrane protein DedA with SNARE-associated domain
VSKTTANICGVLVFFLMTTFAAYTVMRALETGYNTWAAMIGVLTLILADGTRIAINNLWTKINQKRN